MDGRSAAAGPVPDAIRMNTETALARLGPVVPFPLAFDRRSVVWVVDYLERMRADPHADATALVPVLGSFLGQCLAEHHHGTWALSNGEWAVRIPASDGVGFTDAFPFTKLHQQARDGLAAGESFVSFYDLAGHVATRRDPRPREVHGELRMDVSTMRSLVRASLGWRLWVIRVVSGLLLVYALLELVMVGDAGSAVTMLAIGLAFAGHEEILTRLSLRKLRGLTDRPWRYRFGAQGIGVHTPATAVELGWEAIRRVHRGPAVWLVVTTAGGRVPIPRRAFGPADAEQVDHMTAARAGG